MLGKEVEMEMKTTTRQFNFFPNSGATSKGIEARSQGWQVAWALSQATVGLDGKHMNSNIVTFTLSKNTEQKRLAAECGIETTQSSLFHSPRLSPNWLHGNNNTKMRLAAQGGSVNKRRFC